MSLFDSLIQNELTLFAVDLQYISPEQTGRVNRSVDYRTDLYSLGVLLYEMTTGQLPFTATEPLELVHSHISVLPVPPIQVRFLMLGWIV